MKEFPTRYNWSGIEEKWINRWESGNFFHVKPAKDKKPYCIVIPPPNITGSLHMGHALDETIQDILVRFRRMQGYASLWIPGCDHAGIATQNVVERDLAKEGLRKEDIGRDKFIERVWKWKGLHEERIKEQLKRLGASCDWQRWAFTLDEKRARAVREAFVKLY
ncbi:MAG: class I tRNA ligase family protein, partial [Caldiserica bacterium]|nr:class I tRNA ligase family protein [Caldisericota bacterium]